MTRRLPAPFLAFALLPVLSAFAGDLEDRAMKIDSQAKSTEPCDERQARARLRVVRAVDAHPVDDVEEDDTDDRVRIGPLSLVRRTESAPGVEWMAQRFDWESTAELLDSIRDEDAVQWRKIRKRALRLLGYEQDRRVDLEDLSLRREHVDLAPPALSAALACESAEVESGNCPGFERLRETRILSREYLTFGETFRRWKRSADGADFDEMVKTLRKLKERDLPRKTKSVSRTRDGVMVKLLTGDFDGYEAKLASVIRRFWNRFGRVLRIEWYVGEDPSMFVFRFLDRPGRPSSVDRSKRLITLVQGSRESTPAHEMGHVLGFRDNYYNLWDPSRCEYTYQYRSGDLMSEVSKGEILPEHWRALEEVYSTDD
jgi:hypothetical protein